MFRTSCPKHVEFNFKNKFEKLVHLVGFIVRNSVLIFLISITVFILFQFLIFLLNLFIFNFTIFIPKATFRHILSRSLGSVFYQCDRLCGLVVRVSGYRYRGPGFDSRRYQIF